MWTIRPPKIRDIRYNDQDKNYFLQYCSSTTGNNCRVITVKGSRDKLVKKVSTLQKRYAKLKGVYRGK